MPPVTPVKTVRNAEGLTSLGIVRTTVLGSAALMLSTVSLPTSVMRNAGGLLSVMTRDNEKTTSSAVNAVPLAELNPPARGKGVVQVGALSFAAPLVAGRGL